MIGKQCVKIDLTGQRFGRLTVIGEASHDMKTHVIKWYCRCDCGKITKVRIGNLRSGHTQSCGCLLREKLLASVITHGKSYTRLYKIRNGMRQRCRNKNCKSYPTYGGRGIKVCDEWENSFEAFYKWAMENGYADNLTIDRIDVNGNYEPSNCRWADKFTQDNNRRSSHFITVGEKTYTLSEWGRIKGLKPEVIYKRLSRGWKPEEAIMGKKEAV